MTCCSGESFFSLYILYRSVCNVLFLSDWVLRLNNNSIGVLILWAWTSVVTCISCVCVEGLCSYLGRARRVMLLALSVCLSSTFFKNVLSDFLNKNFWRCGVWPGNVNKNFWRSWVWRKNNMLDFGMYPSTFYEIRIAAAVLSLLYSPCGTTVSGRCLRALVASCFMFLLCRTQLKLTVCLDTWKCLWIRSLLVKCLGELCETANSYLRQGALFLGKYEYKISCKCINQFFGGVWHGPRRKWCDFGSSPDFLWILNHPGFFVVTFFSWLLDILFFICMRCKLNFVV